MSSRTRGDRGRLTHRPPARPARAGRAAPPVRAVAPTRRHAGGPRADEARGRVSLEQGGDGCSYAGLFPILYPYGLPSTTHWATLGWGLRPAGWHRGRGECVKEPLSPMGCRPTGSKANGPGEEPRGGTGGIQTWSGCTAGGAPAVHAYCAHKGWGPRPWGLTVLFEEDGRVEEPRPRSNSVCATHPCQPFATGTADAPPHRARRSAGRLPLERGLARRRQAFPNLTQEENVFQRVLSCWKSLATLVDFPT